MTTTYTPAQACAIVSDTTGFSLDPQKLRQWRSRGILRRREQDEGGWTRYSYKEVCELVGIASAMKRGLSIGEAASVAWVIRDYMPGSGGRVERGDDEPAGGGYMLVLGTVPAGREPEPASERNFNVRILLHATEVHQLFSPETTAQLGGDVLLTVMVTELRKRFNAAVERLGASGGDVEAPLRSKPPAQIDSAAIYARFNRTSGDAE